MLSIVFQNIKIFICQCKWAKLVRRVPRNQYVLTALYLDIIVSLLIHNLCVTPFGYYTFPRTKFVTSLYKLAPDTIRRMKVFCFTPNLVL